MNRYISTLLLFILLHSGMVGQGYYNFDSDITEAYQLALQLRNTESRAKLQELRSETPDNLLIELIEDYNDFFELFITEDKDRFEELSQGRKSRIRRLKNGDKTSPYYRFCLAEVNLHWAAARLKFEENFRAAREIYSAYHLLEKNSKLHPEFRANKKSLSIIYALAESVPAWVRSIVGLKGSIALGTREIRNLVKYAEKNPDFQFKEECLAIYAYILFYQNNSKEKAYNLLRSADIDVAASPLLTFLMSNIAQKNGYNDEAIKILEARKKYDQSVPFYYLDFMLGKFKLYRLDRTADSDIRRFIDRFGGRHFVKEAYQKLAWYELVVNNDVQAYRNTLRQSTTVGASLTDEDKQVTYEYEVSPSLDPTLLKARLLFDGGYYDQSYNLLQDNKSSYADKKSSKYEEYNYRLGRVSHALGKYKEGLMHYAAVVDRGGTNMYACSSALQSGLIYEKKTNYERAKKYFKLCLDIDPARYKQSLHAKAKTALKRISEKERLQLR